MGIGVVMLFWGLVLTLASTPISIGLGIWSWINQKRAGERPKLARAAIAAAFPLVPYCALAFFVYAAWCDSKGVDPGIGDTWQVPVRNYVFTMVDDTSRGQLAQAASGPVRITGIRSIVEAGDSIIGESDSEGAFTLQTSTDTLTRYADLTMAAAGFAPPPALQSPAAFYAQHLPRFPRNVGLVLFAAGLLPVWVFWYRRFIRVPKRARL
jgi:hypothetical protein